MPERDNRMVWDGRPLHYEVWFSTLHHRATGTGFWIRYVVESPRSGDGEPYAELWLSRFDAADPAGNFGIARRLPRSALSTIVEPFSLNIGDAALRHDGMAGAFAAQGHDVAWDLAWRPSFTTHLNFFALGYKLPIADTKILSPNPAVAMRGHVTVDGRRYDFDGDPGQQSHVWGRKHTYQWAWCHCNAFDGAGGSASPPVFVGNAGRIKKGQVILPTWTMFTLYLDGEVIDFREPWTMPLARSDWGTGYFHLLGVNAESRINARFRCRPDDMLLAEYVDPDGDPAFNHITCVADLEIDVQKRTRIYGRFRDHRTLRASGTASFEWAGRAGDVTRVRRAVQRGA